jgi:hypothetical protein
MATNVTMVKAKNLRKFPIFESEVQTNDIKAHKCCIVKSFLVKSLIEDVFLKYLMGATLAPHAIVSIWG